MFRAAVGEEADVSEIALAATVSVAATAPVAASVAAAAEETPAVVTKTDTVVDTKVCNDGYRTTCAMIHRFTALVNFNV